MPSSPGLASAVVRLAAAPGCLRLEHQTRLYFTQHWMSKEPSHQQPLASSRMTVIVEPSNVMPKLSPLGFFALASHLSTVPLTLIFRMWGSGMSHLHCGPISTHFVRHWLSVPGITGGGFVEGAPPGRNASFGQSPPCGLLVGLWCARMRLQSKLGPPHWCPVW